MAESEVQKRTCRICGETYAYPEHRSIATRFHCEKCVKIPEDAQRVFEMMRRRMDRMAKELHALKKKAD